MEVCYLFSVINPCHINMPYLYAILYHLSNKFIYNSTSFYIVILYFLDMTGINSTEKITYTSIAKSCCYFVREEMIYSIYNMINSIEWPFRFTLGQMSVILESPEKVTAFRWHCAHIRPSQNLEVIYRREKSIFFRKRGAVYSNHLDILTHDIFVMSYNTYSSVDIFAIFWFEGFK